MKAYMMLSLIILQVMAENKSDTDLPDFINKLKAAGKAGYELINGKTDEKVLNETTVLLEPVHKNLFAIQSEMDQTKEDVNSSISQMQTPLEELRKKEDGFITTYLGIMKEDFQAVKKDTGTTSSVVLDLQVKMNNMSNIAVGIDKKFNSLSKAVTRINATTTETQAQLNRFEDAMKIQFDAVKTEFDGVKTEFGKVKTQITDMQTDITWIKNQLKTKP